MSETHAVPEKSPEGRLKRSVYNLPAHVEALAQAARAFHQDAGHDSDRDLDETLLKLRETVVRLAEELSERKRASADASRYTRRVRIFRERGRMESDRVDYHADDQRRTTFPEPLRSNILVGGDVIPGLAQRCVVEIARIQRHQPDVAQRLMTKPDDELVRILLKDFLRPQAMLQKQVTFTLDQVEFP
jgi:hypothetical protein